MSIIPKHDHSDARLRCQDCSEPICPKCMVQCAVGARCKKCAARFTSHVVQTSPAILARTGVVALIVGFVFGSVQSSMMMGYSIFSWLILVAVGIGVGKLLHRIAGYKLGTKIIATVAGALLVGLLLSPARDTTIMYLTALGQPAADAEEGGASSMMSALVTHISAMLVFVAASVSPFYNKS